MKLVMIGTGYVGLVSGVCFSEFGFHVTCVDKDANKVNQLQSGQATIYEPSLNRLMQQNMQAGRLIFTQDTSSAVRDADAVFLAVGTPPNPQTGEADLQYIFAAAREVAESLKGYTVIVTKSTVPIGTGKQIQEIIQRINPDADFDIASNPEFLREGSAVEDFMKPDRIVIGTTSERAEQTLQKLYRPLTLEKVPIVSTDIETAEMSKYAANSFLATKVAFINEIADLCEKTGANVSTVAKAMGLDPRIGDKFLNPGPGIGGSCFPKDTKALASIARSHSVDFRIVESVIEANDERKHAMAKRIISNLGGEEAAKNKTAAVLGITFKQNTDDIRESPALAIIDDLLRAGIEIRIYDPQGMSAGRSRYQHHSINWCKDSYDCANGADALVVITEWNEFRHLDFDRIKKSLKKPLIIDLRNIYDPREMAKLGFEYSSVGR